MKRLIFLLITMLLPMVAMAEEVVSTEDNDTTSVVSDGFDELMKRYSSQPGCTTINISNSMFRSMEVSIDADYMKVISVENKELIPTFKEQVEELIGAYEVIMSVNSGGESVKIYQKRAENGSATDLYISTSNADSSVLIHLHGNNLELNNIGSLINLHH